MIWLSGKVASYAAAEETLLRIAKIKVSDSTIWRQVQKWGNSFQEKKEISYAETTPESKKGLSMDGATVNLREEGSKELKVGVVYDIESKNEIAVSVNNSYVGYLGGTLGFVESLYKEAEKRHWYEHREQQIIADGAPWIWNLANEYFSESRQTIDWYHASLHLRAASIELHPNNEDMATAWYNINKNNLYQGKLEDVIKGLSDSKEKGYFEKNRERMNYLECREKGYLIGSGVVESAAKQFKARFCGPGMRWSRSGIEHLIPIKAAILSKSFDKTWYNIYYN